MNLKLRQVLTRFFYFCILCRGSYGIRFASYYLDQMVLQRAPASATVWGFDELLPGVESSLVCVASDGKSMAIIMLTPVQTDEEVWQLKLPALDAGTICDITINDGIEAITLNTVIFGDVWLCSGQSNMHFMMKDIVNGTEEIESSSDYTDIRFMTVSGVSPAPLDPDDSDDLKPMPADMKSWYNSSNGDALGEYSAVCFLFARNIYDKLKIPIGLVKAECGGTEIEPWSPAEVMDKCDIQGDPPKCPDSVWHCNTVLYNSKINPLKRMALKGFLWYQGEANSNYNTDDYGCTFPALVDSWRKEFSLHSETSTTAPFGFVQLAANRADYESLGFPKIRWHQTAHMGVVPNDQLENVFMAVALDTYDADSPTGTVHPRYKQIVAERLSLSGLNVAYGEKTLPTNGPYIQSVSVTPVLYKEGLVTIAYDQSITYDNKEISGFYYCCTAYDSCDNDDKNWIQILEVHSFGTNHVTLDVEGLCPVDDSWKIPSLSYLWRETPILGYLAAPIYSTDIYRLPAAPWKISSEKILKAEEYLTQNRVP